MYYIYIVECSDGSLYTGYTNDLDSRIEKHNTGKGAKYTRNKRPVKLVYFEEFEEKNLAQKREYEIKQFTRDKKLRLIKTGSDIVLDRG